MNSLSAKKKRLNPSQLPTVIEPVNTSLAFADVDQNKDIRKELLEKRSTSFSQDSSLKGISIRETFEKSESLLQPRTKTITPMTNMSPRAKPPFPPPSAPSSSSSSSPAMASPAATTSPSTKQYNYEEYREGIKRVALIYTTLILRQEISLQEFLCFFMKLLTVDPTRMKAQTFDQLKEALTSNYFLSFEVIDILLLKIVEQLSIIFKTFGAMILRHFLRYPLLEETSPRISALFNEWAELSENEFPMLNQPLVPSSSSSLSSSALPFKPSVMYQQSSGQLQQTSGNSGSSGQAIPVIRSFMKQYSTAEDNRLEQKTKVIECTNSSLISF
jgi:hypothetical protein